MPLKNDLFNKPCRSHIISASGCTSVVRRCTYVLKINNAHQIKYNALRILARWDSVFWH